MIPPPAAIVLPTATTALTPLIPLIANTAPSTAAKVAAIGAKTNANPPLKTPTAKSLAAVLPKTNALVYG
jgi:hypothetical protein